MAESKSITADGHIDNLLRESRGNGLKALVELWLNSGELFNKEREFMDVLAGVGLDANVTFDDPNAMRSGVFPGWLSIKNPLVVQNIPENVVDSLQEASKRKRAKKPSGGNHDVWDKNLRSGHEWMAALRTDLQRDDADSSTAFTSIPDWVTETLEGLGYDGIFDVGGKLSGQKHTVAIPFVSNQIKSSTGNEGMFSQSDVIHYSKAAPKGIGQQLFDFGPYGSFGTKYQQGSDSVAPAQEPTAPVPVEPAVIHPAPGTEEFKALPQEEKREAVKAAAAEKKAEREGLQDFGGKLAVRKNRQPSMSKNLSDEDPA